ncbi:histidine phosphatase family protein [Alicyclobacillus shizuokensis]|uniref:histidine phosphatase family protein n=1 Tax=Alicyclobacillus shizuokensis TaxID=392014 RepID=UPI0008307079|nr:histidine phosphatase family protein [Alicyclobacillus shizuokensis]MCL6625730.1 histidine phosphatase family protein [Alicyclobacillus shizuokensis]
MLELWLVRHGETDWNLEQRVQGWLDIPLNANGRQQAEMLSHQLQGIPFQALYSSDLTRALTTARILAKNVPLPIRTSPELRERGLGEAEGLLRVEAQRRYPNGAPSRETEEQMHRRLISVMDRIVSEVNHGRVLCVSHGGFIRLWLGYIGHPIPALGNTSVSRVAYTEGLWRVICADWRGHLAHPGRAHGTRAASPR